MNAIFRKNAALRLAMGGILALCVPMSSSAEPSEPAEAVFYPMFQVAKGSGSFLAARPGLSPEPGMPGRAYPYGTRLTVNNDGEKVHVFVAPNRQIHLANGADIVVENDPDAPTAKRAQLLSGTVEANLGRDEEETTPFSIVTQAAVFNDFRGRVAISAQDAGASWKAAVRILNGKVTVSAPQLVPSRLGNSCSLTIETGKDATFTEVDGVAGDYKLLLENGSEPPYEADFHAGSRVKIWRSWAPKSHLLAVAVLIANGDGSVAASYAFNEGQAPVKTGPETSVAANASEDAEANGTDQPEAVTDELSGFDSDFPSTSSESTDTGFDDFSSFSF